LGSGKPASMPSLPSVSRFPAHMRPLVQTKLPFKPISREEWLVQETRHSHDRRAEVQAWSEQLALLQARKMIECRKQERDRKRAQCECKHALRRERVRNEDMTVPSHNIGCIEPKVCYHLTEHTAPTTYHCANFSRLTPLISICVRVC
jgi:hypothetical protein